MPRLFTGLEIPADVGFALSLKRGGLTGARWIDAENYHITLRFIGDVDHQTADEVADSLDRLSNSLRFSVRLTHLGTFGGDKPRALYAGVEPSEHADAACRRRRSGCCSGPACRPKGASSCRMCRWRGCAAAAPMEVARFMAEAGRFEPLSFPVGRFVLFSSKDSVGGGPYVVEQSYPLAA